MLLAGNSGAHAQYGIAEVLYRRIELSPSIEALYSPSVCVSLLAQSEHPVSQLAVSAQVDGE